MKGLILIIIIASFLFSAVSSVVLAQYTLIIWGDSVSNTTATSTRIAFNTNYNATGYVEYGTSSVYNLRTFLLTNYSQFVFVLDNLTSSTTYHYRVVVVDDAGTTATTSDRTVTTLAAPLLPPPLPTPPLAATTSTATTTLSLTPLPPLTLLPTPPAPTLVLTKPLYFGLHHAEVKILQQFLIKQGYLAAGLDTSYFGFLTRTAVRRFQCNFNIACVGSAGYGLVGPKTRAAINALLAF